MAKIVILKNTTVSTIELPELGISIRASDQIDVSEFGAAKLRESAILFVAISNGNIVVNDGIDDLNANDGQAYVENDVTLNPEFVGVTGVRIPLGSTSDRPLMPADGTFRLNTDTFFMEYYEAGEWKVLQSELINLLKDSVSVTIDTENLNFTGNVSITDDGNRSATVDIPLQNLFSTFVGDTGTTTADIATDTLTVSGGTGISTAIVGDVITISNDSPNIDQNLFATITGDTGSTTANTTTDTLTVAGGTDISTTVVGDTITINYVGTATLQNVFETVSGDTGSTTADIATDTLTISGGTGISTAVVGDVLTITNDSPNISQNVFGTIVSDSGSTTADITADTLTISGGTSISTSITGDVLTINYDGMDVLNNFTAIVDPTVNNDITEGYEPGSVWINTTTNEAYRLIDNTDGAAVWVKTTLTADELATVAVSGSYTDLTNQPAIFQNVTDGTNTIVADNGSDTLTFTAGAGVSIVATPASDTITITNTSPNIVQNLFATVAGDTGSTTANIATDTLTIAGGTNITTTVVGDTLTIDTTGQPDQNIWSTITGNTGSTTADTTTDTLSIAGTGLVSTSITGDTLTISTTAEANQNAFANISDGTTTAAADTTTDTFTLTAGAGMSIVVDAGTDTATFTNTAPNIDQNLFATVVGDTGTTTANTTTDTLTVSGGTGISTAIVGDVLTITNDSPNVDQNLFQTFTGDAGSTTADIATDTLTVSGGTGISTSITGDVLTITNDSPNVDQNVFATVTGDTGTTTADITTDTLAVQGGTGISTAVVGDTLTITNDDSGTVTALSTQSLSTSLLEGGALSINVDTTRFDITAGSGYVVDSTTDVNNPVVTNVSWPAFTAQLPLNIGTQPVTYVLISSAGSVITQNTFPTEAQRRAAIFLGVLVHTNNTNIEVVNNLPTPAMDTLNQLRDLADGLGMFNINGNTISSNGANLSINKSAGTIFKIGINFQVDNTDPNTISLASQIPVTFRYRLQNSTEFTNTTLIDPTQYDNGGTLTPVGANDATVQRIYMFPSGVIRIQPGQQIYATLAKALESIDIDPFVVESNIQENGLLIGLLAVMSNCTDLTDSSRAAFLTPNRFGDVAGAGGVSVTDLQGAYNNSLDPEIVLNSNNAGITIIDNASPIGVPLFEIQNNARTVNYLRISDSQVLLYDLSYPIADGTSGQVLTTDGLGNLTFTTVSGVDQNLWSTIVADTGSTTANTTTDSLNIVGGTNVTTSIVGDTLTINASAGSTAFQRAAVNTATYTIDPADTFIGVQYSTTGACSLTMPLGSAKAPGDKITIKDEGGNARINNITVTRSGSDTIDGDTDFVIAINRGAVHLQWTGFEWSII